jgi:acyl-CoA thioesterase
MSSPESFEEALRLNVEADRYQRQVSPFWTFGDGRVFGGYVAALGLWAMGCRLRAPVLHSCHVVFADATRAGPIEVHIDELKTGRRLKAARALVVQEDRPTATVQAWFGMAPRRTLPIPVGLDAAPEAAACEEIRFRRERIPYMGVLEERAIAYPSSYASFSRGPACVDLWARPRLPLGTNDPLLGYLLDIMIFDAHVLDATLWARDSSEIQTASLDLQVTWYGSADVATWRRMRAESQPPEDDLVATQALLTDEQSRVRARASQLGIVRHPRVRGADNGPDIQGSDDGNSR